MKRGDAVVQCLGAICGFGLVKVFMKRPYNIPHGGTNFVQPGYNKGTVLGVEIIGFFVHACLYTVFSATDSHVVVETCSNGCRLHGFSYSLTFVGFWFQIFGIDEGMNT